MLLSTMMTLPLSAQTNPAAGLDIVAAINKGFNTLDLKLTELFRTADSAADIKLSAIASPAYTTLANSLLTPSAKSQQMGATADQTEAAVMAGYTHIPTVDGSGINAVFGSAGAGIGPMKMYTVQQAFINATHFNSFDYPYNPANGIKAYKVDETAAQNLSFDALLTGSANSNHYIATLLDPEDIPPSIQDYIFEQYGKNKDNQKLFKKQKNTQILRNDNGQLVDTLQKYQAKRRRFLALQSVVLSNLQAIKNMGADDQSTKQTLLALANQKDQINQASAITVARLTLMTNIIIADELSKRREIDQRMLSTMTMTLLQSLQQAKQSMEVSTDGSDYKSVKSFIDQNFLGKKDTSTPDVNPPPMSS